MTMRIKIPARVTTHCTNQLLKNGCKSFEEMTQLALEIERKYERLKLFHDNLLSEGAYAPLLAAAGEVSDADLKQMIQEAGWTVHFDRRFGSPSELKMWLNRFRRFRAACLGTK